MGAEAEAGVQAANDANSKATEASIEAQNVWVAETEVELKHKTKVEAFAPTMEELSQKRVQAEADLAHLQEVSKSFASLRSVGAALKVAAGTATEPPAEDVAS